MRETTTRADHERERRVQRDEGELTGQRLAAAKSKLDFAHYAYRWINASPGRIFAKCAEGEWDVVSNDGGVCPDSADIGNAVSQIVGTAPDGSALVAYLCREPKRFYDEDQIKKSQALDAQLADLRRAGDLMGGTLADYVPKEGFRIPDKMHSQ